MKPVPQHFMSPIVSQGPLTVQGRVENGLCQGYRGTADARGRRMKRKMLMMIAREFDIVIVV
jgi:hypothetical protein